MRSRDNCMAFLPQDQACETDTTSTSHASQTALIAFAHSLQLDLPQVVRLHDCNYIRARGRNTMRKTKHRGIGRVAADFLLNLIAYNLIRIPKLAAA